MVRLFIALTPPPEIQAELARFRGAFDRARWVPEAQLHSTLRFVGDVSESQALELEHHLAQVRAAPFELRVKGVGTFARPPRVLWAGVEPEEPVIALAEQVDEAVVSAGLPPEKRPFSPHLTLARLHHVPPFVLRGFLDEHRALQSATFVVSEMRLYASELSSAGARHTVRKAFALDASG